MTDLGCFTAKSLDFGFFRLKFLTPKFLRGGAFCIEGKSSHRCALRELWLPLLHARFPKTFFALPDWGVRSKSPSQARGNTKACLLHERRNTQKEASNAHSDDLQLLFPSFATQAHYLVGKRKIYMKRFPTKKNKKTTGERCAAAAFMLTIHKQI